MSEVSGVLLTAAVVDASGLVKTVARSKRGLWTLVPPAGSQFFEASVDALAWAVGGSGPARHFARTGQDLARANLLCEVWTVQISPEGDPGPAGGDQMAASLLHSFSQVLTETPSFTPPAAPKNQFRLGRFGPPSFPSFSVALNDSQYLVAVPGASPDLTTGILGYDTSYPQVGGTPAGYVDVRVGGADPNASPGSPTSAGDALPYVWVPYSDPKRPNLKYAIYFGTGVSPAWSPIPFATPVPLPGGAVPADFPQAPGVPPNPLNLSTGCSPPSFAGFSDSGQQVVTYTNAGLRYDEATDECVWLLFKALTASWRWYAQTHCGYVLQFHGGGSKIDTGTVRMDGGGPNTVLTGLRARTNGVVGYDDFPLGIQSLNVIEGPFPASGFTVALQSPVSPTAPALGVLGPPGLVPSPLARAGGDFVTVYQALTSPYGLTLLNRAGVVGSLPAGAAGAAVNFVEITERGGRLHIMRTL